MAEPYISPVKMPRPQKAKPGEELQGWFSPTTANEAGKTMVFLSESGERVEVTHTARPPYRPPARDSKPDMKFVGRLAGLIEEKPYPPPSVIRMNGAHASMQGAMKRKKIAQVNRTLTTQKRREAAKRARLGIPSHSPPNVSMWSSGGKNPADVQRLALGGDVDRRVEMTPSGIVVHNPVLPPPTEPAVAPLSEPAPPPPPPSRLPLRVLVSLPARSSTPVEVPPAMLSTKAVERKRAPTKAKTPVTTPSKPIPPPVPGVQKRANMTPRIKATQAREKTLHDREKQRGATAEENKHRRKAAADAAEERRRKTDEENEHWRRAAADATEENKRLRRAIDDAADTGRPRSAAEENEHPHEAAAEQRQQNAVDADAGTERQRKAAADVQRKAAADVQRKAAADAERQRKAAAAEEHERGAAEERERQRGAAEERERQRGAAEGRERQRRATEERKEADWRSRRRQAVEARERQYKANEEGKLEVVGGGRRQKTQTSSVSEQAFAPAFAQAVAQAVAPASAPAFAQAVAQAEPADQFPPGGDDSIMESILSEFGPEGDVDIIAEFVTIPAPEPTTAMDDLIAGLSEI